MLFVLNKQGAPSVAHIAHIAAQPAAAVLHDAAFALAKPTPEQAVDLVALSKQIAAAHPEPPVVVGVSLSCPYTACWTGALGALKQLSKVADVIPLADTADYTASLYLKEDLLPNIDIWRREFAHAANGTFLLRGIEMTLQGKVTEHFGLLTLLGNDTRPDVVLGPLQAPDKVQWDAATRTHQPMTEVEATAYDRLSAELAAQPNGTQVQVTGPLKKHETEFFLEVREFKI
jgi:hypothetical protein